MTIINSVIKGGGTTPTGTKNITSNGVYDVTDFASADVQVPTTAPAYYIEKTKDANNKLVNGTSVMSFAGLTDVGNYALYSAYAYNTNITGSVDLSSLTTVSGVSACEHAFEACTYLTSVDISGLTTVSGLNGCANMFSGCSRIAGALDLSSLTTISAISGCQNMFRNCTSLTSIDISGLLTADYGSVCNAMFLGCTSLTVIIFDSLVSIKGQTAFASIFWGCTNLTSISFPALTSTSFGSYTNQFNNMLRNVTGCTVHFPSNLQSVIGSWSDVTSGFGGTNTTVLFDLPATA